MQKIEGLILLNDIMDKKYLFTAQQATDFVQEAIKYQRKYIRENRGYLFEYGERELYYIEKQIRLGLFKKSFINEYQKALDFVNVSQLTAQEIFKIIDEKISLFKQDLF